MAIDKLLNPIIEDDPAEEVIESELIDENNSR